MRISDWSSDVCSSDLVTLPLMLALERLSPLERAAFLLHDVFGQSFDEIAAVNGRDPAACRQLAARARAHVRAERPRYPVERAHGQDRKSVVEGKSECVSVDPGGSRIQKKKKKK